MDKCKRSILLKNIPLDIKKYILKTQFEIKSQKDVEQYSQAKTVIQMLREHKEFKERNNGKL